MSNRNKKGLITSAIVCAVGAILLLIGYQVWTHDYGPIDRSAAEKIPILKKAANQGTARIHQVAPQPKQISAHTTNNRPIRLHHNRSQLLLKIAAEHSEIDLARLQRERYRLHGYIEIRNVSKQPVRILDLPLPNDLLHCSLLEKRGETWNALGTVRLASAGPVVVHKSELKRARVELLGGRSLHIPVTLQLPRGLRVGPHKLLLTYKPKMFENTKSVRLGRLGVFPHALSSNRFPLIVRPAATTETTADVTPQSASNTH